MISAPLYVFVGIWDGAIGRVELFTTMKEAKRSYRDFCGFSYKPIPDRAHETRHSHEHAWGSQIIEKQMVVEVGGSS